MGRETGRPITFFDAKYMVDNEGFAALQTIPQTAQCLTRTAIENYLDVDTSYFSTYASNQLVPYNKLVPAVRIIITSLTGSTSSDVVYLNWTVDSTTQIDYYILEYKIASDTTWNNTVGQISAPDDDYSHGQRQFDTTYDYRLRAHDVNGNISGWSNIFTITTISGATSLSISPTTTLAPSGGNSFVLNITSNTSWTLSDNQSWISASATSGTGNASVTITTTSNSGAQRTGTVTVSISGSSKTCTITQSAASTVYTQFLSSGNTSNNACSEFNQTWYTDTSDWIRATKIWTNSSGTFLAFSGWYSDGGFARYWNGSSFTSQTYCGF
jgi:hypothetical protein